MLSLVNFLRIRDWWYLNGLFLLGYVYSGGRLDLTKDLFLGLLISSFYLAHGYSMNEYFDRMNARPRNTQEKHRVFYLNLFMGTFLLNVFLSWHTSTAAGIIVILGGILSWVYSAPPLYLKRMAWGRLFLNALGFSLLFLLGAVFSRGWGLEEILLSLNIFLIFIPAELFHNLNDMAMDKSDGILTFPLKYGIDAALNAVTTSVFILVLYTFLFSLTGSISPFMALLNGVFSVAFVLLGKSCRNFGREIPRFVGVKSHARLILAIYGMSLLIIFAFIR